MIPTNSKSMFSEANVVFELAYQLRINKIPFSLEYRMNAGLKHNLNQIDSEVNHFYKNKRKRENITNKKKQSLQKRFPGKERSCFDIVILDDKCLNIVGIIEVKKSKISKTALIETQKKYFST